MFDNGRHGRPVTGAGNRPLKSISDMLKGKQGRFRQNLLGKRVDYSGRSVIVIGPDLKLNQCGLPKKMALTLFEPFIIRRLKELGFVHTVRSARKMIEKKSPEVWDILEEVTEGHPVMLNRAPTLHRLSFRRLKPRAYQGDAIRLHPLVCAAYNADFDGDQMAVHVPLSLEAILEAKLLMLASNNIFSPSSGKPILTPSQDIVLGCYYLTYEPSMKKEKGQRVPLLSSLREVEGAHAEGMLRHDWIDYVNTDYGKDTIFGDKNKKIIRTTPGRVIFNTIWPEQMGFVNFVVPKGKLGDLILNTFKICGRTESAPVLDRLKKLGFRTATLAGISIGIGDMNIPAEKKTIIAEARAKIKVIENEYHKGTNKGRSFKQGHRRIDATDEIAKKAFDNLSKVPEKTFGRQNINPVYILMDSGARGNKAQVRQLCGARGLMAKPNGEIIERPILSSFREGLSVHEYFISTHGARKGLADTALKTADAGYMTRKLCDVAMDVIITEEDDGNRDGIWKQAIYDGDDEIVSLFDRIVGRCSSEDIKNPTNPSEIIVHNGDLITEAMAKRIGALGIERVKIMSPLTHLKRNAIPAKLTASTRSAEAVERGTRVALSRRSPRRPVPLTMRTFHVRGVAQAVKPRNWCAQRGKSITKTSLRVASADDARHELPSACSINGHVTIMGEEGNVLEDYTLAAGALITAEEGQMIKKGTLLARWDPHNIPIMASESGIVQFKDLIDGLTYRSDFDPSTGRTTITISDHKEDLNPTINIVDKKTKEIKAFQAIPTGAQVIVSEGDEIALGMIMAKTPRSAAKTQDITGGLPRVAELFEARRPKDASEIARSHGIVKIGGTRRKKTILRIVPKGWQEGDEGDEGAIEEHLIPANKRIIVQPDDEVKRGQPLTEGGVDPSEVLEVMGSSEVQEYIIREIQKVYRSQGVTINDKHIEVIASRMLRKVRVSDPGDSDYFWGQQVDRYEFMESNRNIVDAGGKAATAEPILLGITKASLETESFISAASFQETTRVLTEAATLGKKDDLSGFKENVIMGNLIPAGTGLAAYRKVKVNAIGHTPLGGEDSLEGEATSEADA